MARLTSQRRNKLPGSSFAGPGRSFPIEDKIHAEKALQLAPRSRAAGNISPMQEAMIRTKAKKVLAVKAPQKSKIARDK